MSNINIGEEPNSPGGSFPLSFRIYLQHKYVFIRVYILGGNYY